VDTKDRHDRIIPEEAWPLQIAASLANIEKAS
jgi:hypothetical protein